MDPFIRLTVWMWQLSRRRVSRHEIIIVAIAASAALAIGFIEWAGYWPSHWKVERVGIPNVPRPL